jgi:hypothetical protein
MSTLTDTLSAAAANTTFRAGSDVDAFFTAQTGLCFVDWFNSQCPNWKNWPPKVLGSSPDVKARFLEIWNHIPEMFGATEISLTQFAALMSILINEVGRQLLPISEQCGRAAQPGLAYAFNTIPGIKRTYNALPANKLAGDLFFKDQDFWTAHQAKAPAASIRQRPDLQPVWNADVYPQDVFSPSLDPSLTGYIQEADFYKFRGRGFIQVTWRANYKRIVAWVRNYPGNNATIVKYRSAWQGVDFDRVATTSSNQDWDDLFQNSDLAIPCAVIGLHNQASGNYLNLATLATTLSSLADAPGTLYRMGLRISGSPQYATLFHDRVLQLIAALNYGANQSSQPQAPPKAA